LIRTFDYRRSLAEIRAQVDAALARVLASGTLIHGPETEAFEREFARFVGARHCIAVGSGTAALHLALWALGLREGDEVITVSNTCVPTVSAIRLTGATPVFVDVRSDDLLMDVARVEERISARTRCILPVHLWGAPVDLDPLLALARRHSLAVVEDCAQAHGSRYRGRMAGTFGAAGCFSFYPTKNIGAYGDAGAVVTDDDALAGSLRRLRTYGYDERGLSLADGTNARASEMQCAVLRVKLAVYGDWLARRLRVAARYDEGIRNPRLRKPLRRAERESTYHQYVLRCEQRDALAAWLTRHDIGFGIHYPVPVHRMPGYARFAAALPVTERAAGEILSLPIHEALSEADAGRVIEVLERFAPA
jgi:aminotransferase EvaB